jgi:hypothetical protein
MDLTDPKLSGWWVMVPGESVNFVPGSFKLPGKSRVYQNRFTDQALVGGSVKAPTVLVGLMVSGRVALGQRFLVEFRIDIAALWVTRSSPLTAG